MSARQTKTAGTRTHLFDCALTLFSQRGYAATSIRDIIKAAGVTQPTLYYHFEDKVDLFRKLVEHYYGENLQQLKTAIEQLPDCQSRLLAMVQSSFEFCNADPRVPCLLFQTYYGPPVEEIKGILEKLTTKRSLNMKTKWILTALMALTLGVAALGVTGCSKSGDDHSGHTHQYTCPMKEHSDVVQNKPGNCPKCGMKLVEKK